MSQDLKVCISLSIASIPNHLNLEMIAFILTAFGYTPGCESRRDARHASLAYGDWVHHTRVFHPSRVHQLWSFANLTKLSLRYILYSIQWVLVDHVERTSGMR